MLRQQGQQGQQAMRACLPAWPPTPPPWLSLSINPLSRPCPPAHSCTSLVRLQGKLFTEELLDKSGVNWTSVRPVYIYGAARRGAVPLASACLPTCLPALPACLPACLLASKKHQNRFGGVAVFASRPILTCV